jgi:hypothetical protein
MNKPDISYSRNCAEMYTGRYKIYYGADITDPKTGDWMLVIWKNDKQVFSATNSELLAVAYGERPSDLMLAGLALYLAK